MSRACIRRGQPLVALSVLIGGWTVARYAAWSLLGSDPFAHAPLAAGTPSPVAPKVAARILPQADGQSSATQLLRYPMARNDGGWPKPLQNVSSLPLEAMPVAAQVAEPSVGLATPPASMPVTKDAQAVVATMGGHQLLWLAAFSKLPLPPEAMNATGVAHGAAPIPPAKPRSAAAKVTRWSADGWVLLRQNAGSAGLAAIGGSYGASQAGAVLRYRLDTASAHRPNVYLRLTGALNGTREQDAALGLSARPLSKLPLVAMAEMRVSRTSTGTHLRPAAALVTELPAAKLPLGLRGEAYGQAGWVGGANATGFVDAQVRVDRKILSFGSNEMRAGAGAWGGAQKGASRLDVGPSANISLRLGDSASAKVSADWRFRISGTSAPASGPALTLSAGF